MFALITAQELLWRASRDAILDNTTREEQIEFVKDQIKDPYSSGDGNYMKKLAKMIPNQDELDEVCSNLFTDIQDVFSGLEIDVSEYEQHLFPIAMAIYKFFIKNASKLMYIFIREFLYNNKNRKVLVSEFTTSKMPNYPKEQYGKKEFYILITKLHAIVDEIFEGDDIRLKKFVEYVEKSTTTPVYLEQIKDALSVGILVDKGVVSDMYHMYKKSDSYQKDMSRLEMDITQTFIIPYLEENGLMDIRTPPVEEIPVDASDDDEDEADDD